MEAKLEHVGQTFPVGTVVGLYRGQVANSGVPRPAGAAILTATVQADESLTFVGVPEDQPAFWAAAEFAGLWRLITVTTRVGSNRIGEEQIETRNLRAGAVTAAKIAGRAITSALLALESVLTEHLGKEAVTEPKLSEAVKTKLRGPQRYPISFTFSNKNTAMTAGGFLTPVGVYMPVAAGETVKLVGAKHKIASGTKMFWRLLRNGVAVTGYKAIPSTTVVAEINVAAIELAAGDLLEVEVEVAEGEPKGPLVTLFFESTRSGAVE